MVILDVSILHQSECLSYSHTLQDSKDLETNKFKSVKHEACHTERTKSILYRYHLMKNLNVHLEVHKKAAVAVLQTSSLL